MLKDFNWFQLGSTPSSAMSGTYDIKLVALSYLIAVLASYVALDFAGRLRAEKNTKAIIYWLLGGAFAMGAGIWSMHFIGMLAFQMSMPMGYELSWTIYSLITAFVVSGFALFVLRDKNRPIIYTALSGILIGLGIATMHYMGMQGMKEYVNIHYLPSLFFLSIAIAIFAAEAALWLMLQSNYGSIKRQFNLKIISALVMGIAICGMHYTGMAAAVFTPLQGDHDHYVKTIEPTLMAFYIAGVTGLIISLALTVSTYYKQMVNAVQNEKEFLNAMLDNLEDGIIACDENGKITVINDVLQKNVAHKENEKFSNRLSDYFDLYSLKSTEPLQGINSPLLIALNGERIHAMELTMKFKNGLKREVVIDGQPIINQHGKKLGAVIVIHDITELKQTERMKSEFVSVVSHELRTPLTSIRGSLGLIMGGTVGKFSEQAGKLLDIASKNSERLLLLISDILDMEKIQTGKMEFQIKSVDITQLVNESISTNNMYGEKFNVKIQLSESIDGVNLYVDPNRLMQVLTNLISNAVKFSHQGGTVKVGIQKIDHSIRIYVADNGTGIPIEFQSRIFQKFAQADSSSTRGKSGTGLGLSISKAMIEKLGGTLKFTSKPNEGSTFYIDFPIVDQILDGNVFPENSKFSNKLKKILICEDDEDQAKYLSVLLEGAGLSSDISYSVTEAKKLLAENNYHALVLDLILPDQDGISFIRELRSSELYRDLPIVVVSLISKTGKVMLNGAALSVVEWLDKPINFSKVLQAIKRIKHKKNNGIPHILHVEDDVDTQQVIATLLEKEAKVTSAPTLKITRELMNNTEFDLVILDLLLPDGNGIDLLPIFSNAKLPVIVYSATELDREYSEYVVQALVKSQISNDELVTKIKHVFEEQV